ncbi:MAG TPA: YceI family protein [Rhizobacter sp.]|nr:YceI family protein [Rhizobacter sp.]
MRLITIERLSHAGRSNGGLRRALALLLAGGSVLTVPLQARSATYVLDPNHTHVQWEVRHFGTSTSRGRFDDIQGNVTLDRAAGRGEVSIVINTASVSSGFAPLDSVLRSNDFLASADNPQAYFVATQWHVDANGLPELRGEFTLRGISQPLSLRATHFNCYTHPTLLREVCGGDFEAELSRADFGITFGLPLVSGTVRLQIQVEGIRQAE